MKRTPEERKASQCNERIVETTMAITGESKQLIQHAITFLQDFIIERMKEGSFESVRIQSFGTFKPKLKRVQWINHQKTLPDMYKKLLIGQRIAASQHKRLKNKNNETTDDQPGLAGG